MEMHHKLRRDPTWHPNACNLCGVLGHQASVCPNGTVNWREKYGGSVAGDEQEERWRAHFTMVPAVYASEDPSCSFGNGWRRHEDEDEQEGDGAEGEGRKARRKGGYRAPRTPARVAASDPKAVEEAAREWARQRRESGRAEREPIPPARRERQQQPQPQPPQPQMMMTMPPPQMMMMPPPPFYAGVPPSMPPPGYYGGPPAAPPPPQMMTTMMRPPPPQQQQWQQQQQPPPSASSTAAAVPAAAAAPSTKRPAAPGSPPPAGWGKAVDSKGRTYYWNKKDKTKVSWKKPEPSE